MAGLYGHADNFFGGWAVNAVARGLRVRLEVVCLCEQSALGFDAYYLDDCLRGHTRACFFLVAVAA